MFHMPCSDISLSLPSLGQACVDFPSLTHTFWKCFFRASLVLNLDHLLAMRAHDLPDAGSAGNMDTTTMLLYHHGLSKLAKCWSKG